MSTAIPRKQTYNARPACEMVAIQMNGVPATMHHKTTAKRGVRHAAAIRGFLQGGGNVFQRASRAAQEEMHAQLEYAYMKDQKHQLFHKAAADPSIGGYVMLWEDRDAEASRFCKCTPKYDVVAVPIRCHSPFTYDDLLIHARKDLDDNLCNYILKVLVCILFSILIVPLIIAFQTNCLFFKPLRNLIASLNRAAFWARRQVRIFLTPPATWLGCCYDKKRHCVVLQYGLNGQPFTHVIYVQEARQMMAAYGGVTVLQSAQPIQQPAQVNVTVNTTNQYGRH